MKKRWFWITTLVMTIIASAVWFRRTDAPVTVETVVLSPTRVEQTVSCNGVVEAVDGIGVFLPVECYIREICVVSGQRVKKGDVIAVIDKEASSAATDNPAVQVALAAMEEELTAPSDGIIVKVNAKEGESLKVGAPCVSLVRPCDLQVRVAIREKELRTLREGMRVRLSGDGLEQATYEGILTEIAATASSSSSTTVVEGVVVPEEGEADDSFRLGLSAKAVVITSVTEEGYLVPYEAVLADESGSYVYVLTDGVAQRKSIDVAAQVSGGVLLTSTDWNGVAVITEPEKVSGDGVRVVEAVR